jgi:apolipoprotein N-acyltransferase
MWFFSTGMHHVWLLAWLAPLPLLLVLPELSAARAALAAFVAAALGATSFVLAYRDLPLALVAGLIPLIALPFTLVAVTWRSVARDGHPGVAVVGYAALVTAMEHLLSRVSPHGTFGSLAYSQGDVPVVLQLASVTGVAGITFLLSLIPAALAVAWRERRDGGTAAGVLAFGGVPLALALGFGLVRLAAPDTGAPVAVGLAASDPDAGRHSELVDSAAALSVVRAYVRRAGALADRGVRVVVLPEKFAGVTPAYEAAARALLRDAARAHTVTIVAGLNLLGGAERRNVALVFGPGGDQVLAYDKQHLGPGLEAGYRRGSATGLVAGAAVPTGVAICKDLDFSGLGRAYAAAGVGLLLVPAWDFVRDGWLHSRMALVRGVEGGYAVARSANDGLLTVSDARGRVLAERASGDSAEVLLAGVVPVGQGGTLYSRGGDWFAWLSIVAAACTVAAGRRAPRTMAT